MRVIILAASAQKATVVDKLIDHPNLSKIVLSITSQKLVNQAQALIIYFESVDDLKKMSKLLKIYSGCPLKFYFGNKKIKNFQHFYEFHEADRMIKDIFSQFEMLASKADTLYERVLKKDEETKQISVESMIAGIRQKDIIEEQCVEFFAKKAKQGKGAKAQAAAGELTGDQVIVEKERFRRWWVEGKLDNFEIIKYYLIGWMVKEIGQLKLKEEDVKTKKEAVEAIKEFRSYHQKRREIKMLKEHYDNNFNLKIEGIEKKEEKKGVFQIPAFKKLGDALGKQTADVPPTTAAVPKDQVQPAVKATVASSAKPGTNLDAKITIYPDKSDESLMYYQNLHMFKGRSWFSIGFKPNAKDLKTFIEDLNQMDYLRNNEDEDLDFTVVLDGRKVRIGCESDTFDPLKEDDEANEQNIEILNSLKVKDQGVVQQAEFEISANLGQKLSDILTLSEPIVVSLFKSLQLSASLKFHLKQFKQVFENTSEHKIQEYVQTHKAGKEGAKGEDEAADKLKNFFGQKLEAEGAEVAKSEEPGEASEKAESEHPSKGEEEEDSKKSGGSDDGYGDEDEDDGDGYGDEEEDDESDEESEEDDEEAKRQEMLKKGLDLKPVLKSLLPFFLFKWNAKIDMQPELDDIREHCRDHKHESFLLKNYQEIILQTQGVNLKDQTSTAASAKTATIAKKGSKLELINYLIEEVGDEIEFAWRSKYFYISGQIKTDDLGQAILMLNKGGLV